jgi:RNA polymerase sigma-70 factor, ECF subfamily
VRSLVQTSTSGDPRDRPRGAENAALNETPDRPPLARQFVAVWRLLRRLGVPDSEADDATQQVFLVVTERKDAIEPGKDRSFIYGTALRVASRVLRKPRPPPASLDEDSAIADDAAPIEDLLDRHEARRTLDQLLEQMPFDLRAVFVLFEIEELSLTEIAQTLEIPRGTAASRLRRAREDFEARVTRLRARLSRHGAKR